MSLSIREKYRTICKEQKNIPIFLQDWWLDAVSKNWSAAIAMNGSHVGAILPFIIEQKIGISIFRNPVLTPYLGPHIFFPEDLKASKRDNFEHEMLSELYKQISPAKVWTVNMKPGFKQVGFFKANGFDVMPRQTFIMLLQEDEEQIFLKLHEDYRRNIRKAEQEMQIANEPEKLSLLYDFQKATLDRKDVNMHFSMQQLQQVFDACMKNNSAALWVAKKGNEIQAILWHIWDEEKAYYLVGSKNPEVKDNRAMTALIWRAIKESKKMNKQNFDFEGSMDAGVERFFRNFGAERTIYLSVQKNKSLPWKIIRMLRG